MKNVFLNELEKRLELEGVENIDEILDIYEKRFELGKEAGMTEEEVISMLDDVDTIVDKYTTSKTDFEKCYDLTLDLNWFDDFDISVVPGAELKFEIDSEAFRYVEIVKDGNQIHLKDKDKNLSKRSRFDGKLMIGEKARFHSFTLNNATCDIRFPKVEISCDTFKMANANGDISFPNVNCTEYAKIVNANGDITIESVVSPKLDLTTVTGDISIKEMVSDIVHLSTVSGDICVSRSNSCECKANSVSGDITIKECPADIQISASMVTGSLKVNGETLGVGISALKKGLSKIKF